MSEQLIFPWISVSVVLMTGATLRAWRQKSTESARKSATVVLAIVAIFLVMAGIEVTRAHGHSLHEPLPAVARWFSIDALNGLPLPIFALLTLGMVVLAPKRKVTPRWIAGILLLGGSTIAAYAADNMLLFALAWAVTLVPFIERRFFDQSLPSTARFILLGSLVAMAVGVALIAMETPGADLQTKLSMTLPRPGQSHLLFCAFACLIVAVILRKGLFPAHTWVTPSFEEGPLIPLTLLFNGHLGAFLIVRLVRPALPDLATMAMPYLGYLGLFTAAYTTLLAIAARSPRRILALLTISQASFLVVGLESSSPVAIAGALVHWQVVVIATSMLAAVCAAIEARLGSEPDGYGFLGLAFGAPRLAVFFLSAGLALVGLPLTLGFCAEDLLLHGTLETHPHLGIVMPIVTALNAFHVIRLFAALFLGKPSSTAVHVADALPRERWVLTAALLILLIGGLQPALFTHLASKAAARVAAGASESVTTTTETALRITSSIVR